MTLLKASTSVPEESALLDILWGTQSNVAEEHLLSTYTKKKKNAQEPNKKQPNIFREDDGVISEDDRLATSLLPLWETRGTEDSGLAGETFSFSPS